ICQRYIDISLSDTPHISARYMSTPRSCARAQNARSSPQTRLQTRPTRGNFGLNRLATQVPVERHTESLRLETQNFLSGCVGFAARMWQFAARVGSIALLELRA